MSAQEQHEKWMAHKRADGWVYREVKDTDKKTHPCMLPYWELPPAQQIKDAIFGCIVRGVFQHYSLPWR